MNKLNPKSFSISPSVLEVVTDSTRKRIKKIVEFYGVKKIAEDIGMMEEWLQNKLDCNNGWGIQQNEAFRIFCALQLCKEGVI